MLLFAEGFDGIGPTGTPEYEAYLFDYVATSYCAFSTNYGRLDIGAQISTLPSIGKIISMSGSTLIMGIAIKRVSVVPLSDGHVYNEYLTFFSAGAGSTPQITVTLDSTGTELQIRGGDYNDTVLATSAFNQVVGDWYYLELKIVFNSSGSVEMKIDGSVVASATGVNTDIGETGTCGYIELGANSSYHLEHIDDWYICDATGSYNNTYLGDVWVKVAVPTSDGVDQDFAYSTGSDGYALVDEIPPAAADYVVGDAVGERFSVGVTASDDGRSIFGIVVNQIDLNTDAGTRGFKQFVNNAATEVQSAGKSANITPHRRSFVVERDPDSGGAWTPALINSAEFGVEITS